MKTTEESPIPRSRPKFGLWLIFLVALIAVGLTFGLLPRLRHDHALARDTAELAVPTVEVVEPKPGQKLAGLLLPAEARPYIEAPIYARANGYITKWQADIGAAVKAGQTLAEIDTPDLDQELEGAKAGLVQAQAALALSKITADRWAELLKTSSVSEQENAEKAADLKLKVADVDAAKATVKRDQDLKDFCHVVAPFDGTVTARDIDVGDLISPGKELFRLSDTRTLRVYVRVPQPATAGLAVGAAADIILPERPNHPFPAKVVRTSRMIDTSSRTLLVELDVTNTDDEIVAGSYAQVSFHDMGGDPALILPSNTLLFRAEGPQVGVVLPTGHVELHDVLLGRDLGANIEILSGVSTGDKVIINPSDSLVTGTEVHIDEAAVQNVAAK